MFMNVGGYTAPPPVWPPKQKTSGLGLYLVQNFVTPQRLIAPLMSARIQIPSGWATPPPSCPQMSGMGCCSSCANGGTCEGHNHGMGMGQLFASGTDISGWGWGEWTVVGVGAAAGISLLGNVASAGKSIKRAVKRRRS